MQELYFILCDAIGHHSSIIPEGSWRDGRPRPSTVRPRRVVFRELLLILHHFRINLDLDDISDHGFAGLEKIVVDEIEILAVDGRCRGNSAARIAPRIAQFRSGSINVKRDFARGSM